MKILKAGMLYPISDYQLFKSGHGCITLLFLAQAGDVVILSPASVSFDMFRDFEERGRYFKDVVMKLVSRKS
jgi:hypothetical protein